MGCGSSNTLAVPSSSTDYKYLVEEAWDKASRTVDRSTESSRRLVIKRRGWQTIRIFVSSTFKDFHAEREVLIKEVFPDLRQWCNKRRLHLIECDLRWGVPKDTTTGETLRLCLEEIDRCYHDSIMPFFLNLTSERCGWIPTFDDVPQSIVQEYRWVHGLSVTEMEILHGAYRTDNPNSFFMVREQSFLEKLPREFEADFVDANPIANHKLDVLKRVLKQRLPDRISWYHCSFSHVDDDGKVEFQGLRENFAQPIFQFFKSRIEEQYPIDNSPTDPDQITHDAHESFVKTRGNLVLGRNSILDQIKDYVVEVGVDFPLVLLGGPGSGKSAILARTADVSSTLASHNRIPGGGEHGWHVFYHFVGAIPGSTDLELCLKRFLREINAVNESTMPKGLESVCQTTCSVLSNVKTRPTIIIIDALNQFDDDKAATILSWLPRKLAPSVRVIISMIPDTPPHVAMKARSYKAREILVTPLDMTARQDIVKETLGKYNKQLDEQQMSSLLSKESSQNPLWLAVACEELRVFGLFNKITDKINSLADGLLELLEQVFDRFEEENGGQLLTGTLCLLETSKTGLLETELLNILGDEDNLLQAEVEEESTKDHGKREKKSKDIGPLPSAKWAPVYRALRPFLRPFGDSGEGRLDFYHRALSKAVRNKYFARQAAARNDNWWHSKLAAYFSQSVNIKRKVEELPYHQIQCGDKSGLRETLMDWRIFDLLYNEDYSSSLMRFWREGFGEGMQNQMKTAYEEALSNMANEVDVPMDLLGRRYEQIARVMIHAGDHSSSFVLLERAMAIETEKMNSRPERMVEMYELAATIYDDKLKLYQFIERWQISELRPLIDYCKKSIEIRETLPGDRHKFKLAKTLMVLAFNLEAWMECGADNTLSAEEAITEGKECIERAMDIFKELNNDGFVADALMTKGILLPRGSDEQLKVCMDALDLCLQAYGEYSVLTSRLYLNIGIFHEDNRRFEQACEWFLKWREVTEEVFGYHHPKAKRARDTLSRPRYCPLVAEIKQREREQAGLENQLAEEHNEGFVEGMDNMNL